MTIDQVKKFRETEELKIESEKAEELFNKVIGATDQATGDTSDSKTEVENVKTPEVLNDVENYLSMDLPELRVYAKSKGLKFPGFTGKEKLIKLLEQ
jgi:hypothetical protein